MAETLKDKIIDTLLEYEIVTQKDLDSAFMLQKTQGGNLIKILVDKGYVSEKDLLALLVRELNIPFINLSKYKIDPELKEIVPEKFARQYNIIPLSQLDDRMTVVLSDPFNLFVVDDLKNITGKEIDLVMSTHEAIVAALDIYYGSEQKNTNVSDFSQDIELEDFEILSENDGGQDMDGAVDESEKAPIVRMVNLILKEAIKQRSSDIHIEPMFDGVRVRYRVDGILQDILTIPKENQNAVLVRIKILSRLDITVNQIPQDGRFKLKIGNSEIDFRVSLLPTTFGQKVVLRVLDKRNLSVGLKGLGLSSHSLGLLEEGIRKPFGMILVTGPTGSGKSTSLYSMINELNTVDRNIITVEEPVEYLIEGLTQIHARPEIGLTFAEGLRAILRQSPDIVMVGEIRDSETADIAIKSALTGQLVFSTLHTNDASGALTRLVDMGVEPFLVSSSVVLVSAQRLCRKICQDCKMEDEIAEDLLEKLEKKIPEGVKFYKGKGCKSCRNTGYKGRTSITEVLEIDDDIRNLLLNGKTSDEIKEFAIKKKGMITLFEDAFSKFLDGITTYEEVLRVTSVE